MTKKFKKSKAFWGKMVHLRHPGSVKKAREGAKMLNIDWDNPDRVFEGVLDDLGLPQGLLVIFSQWMTRYWPPWELMFYRPAGVLNIACYTPPSLFCV